MTGYQKCQIIVKKRRVNTGKKGLTRDYVL